MIVYCASDLIFATKIRSTADAMGVPSRPVRDGDMLQKRLDRLDDGKCNEPVTAFFVDLDTGDDGITLIKQLKQSSSSAMVIAFGSHVAVELLDSAKAAGSDYVLARSQFTEQLPQLIQQFGSQSRLS